MKIILSIVLIVASHTAVSAQLCPTEDTVLPDVYIQNADNLEVRAGITISAEIVANMVANNCFGSQTDIDSFTKKLLEKLQNATNSNDKGNVLELKKNVDDMLVDLIAYAEQQAKMTASVETAQVWAEFIHRLNTLLLTRNVSQADFTIGIGQRDDLTTKLISSYSGLSVVTRHCPESNLNPWQGDACVQAVKETIGLFRGLVLASKVIHAANLDTLNLHLVTIENRLKGYKDYYQKAEPLWPWESLFNTSVVTAKDKIQQGNLVGFREPVEYQWLVLHPSTALQYVSDQETDFKPALIVDVLGYNKLKWENNGSEVTSYGASAVVALSEFDGKTNIGWGMRFFYNRTYSFGITKNSDQVGLFISVGALEKFNNWNVDEDKFLKFYDEISTQF